MKKNIALFGNVPFFSLISIILSEIPILEQTGHHYCTFFTLWISVSSVSAKNTGGCNRCHQFRFRYLIFSSFLKKVIKRLIIHQEWDQFWTPCQISVMIENVDNCVTKKFSNDGYPCLQSPFLGLLKMVLNMICGLSMTHSHTSKITK